MPASRKRKTPAARTSDPARRSVLADADYARDEAHVFFRGRRLRGADPLSFRPLPYEAMLLDTLLGEHVSAGTGAASGFFRDREHVFYQGRLVTGADPETFLAFRYPYGQIEAVDRQGAYTTDPYRREGYRRVEPDEVFWNPRLRSFKHYIGHLAGGQGYWWETRRSFASRAPAPQSEPAATTRVAEALAGGRDPWHLIAEAPADLALHEACLQALAEHDEALAETFSLFRMLARGAAEAAEIQALRERIDARWRPVLRARLAEPATAHDAVGLLDAYSSLFDSWPAFAAELESLGAALFSHEQRQHVSKIAARRLGAHSEDYLRLELDRIGHALADPAGLDWCRSEALANLFATSTSFSHESILRLLAATDFDRHDGGLIVAMAIHFAGERRLAEALPHLLRAVASPRLDINDRANFRRASHWGHLVLALLRLSAAAARTACQQRLSVPAQWASLDGSVFTYIESASAFLMAYLLFGGNDSRIDRSLHAFAAHVASREEIDYFVLAACENVVNGIVGGKRRELADVLESLAAPELAARVIPGGKGRWGQLQARIPGGTG